FAQLQLDIRYAPPRAFLAARDLLDRGLLRLERPPRRSRALAPLGAWGRVGTGAAAEDQRVEQRVGTQPVAAVDRDARRLAGRVEAGDVGAPVDIGLNPAHRVVVAGL